MARRPPSRKAPKARCSSTLTTPLTNVAWMRSWPPTTAALADTCIISWATPRKASSSEYRPARPNSSTPRSRLFMGSIVRAAAANPGRPRAVERAKAPEITPGTAPGTAAALWYHSPPPDSPSPAGDEPQGETERMLIVMKMDAAAEQVEGVVQKVQAHGLKAHPIAGAQRTAIGITRNIA